jgi:chemotaxis response regulator CheB
VHALQMFFESLPDDVDAAFVVVVHLDPSRQSELSNIVAARTRMPVTQVSGLTLIEPRHVYVIRPNRQLRATDHHFAITEFDEPRWQRAPLPTSPIAATMTTSRRRRAGSARFDCN